MPAPIGAHSDDLVDEDDRWAIESLGCVGLMVIALPTNKRSLHDTVFNPLWAAAQDLGVPVLVHSLSSLPDSEGHGPLVDISAGVKQFGGNIFLHHLVSHRFQQRLAVASFIVGGVCERFLNLRLVFTEGGGAWVQSWIDAIDEHYQSTLMRRSVPWLTMKPSKYVHRPCLVAFGVSDTLAEGTVGGTLPIDCVTWGSDYPHYDSIFPGAVDRFCVNLKGRSEKERVKILGGNAKRFFRSL